MNQNTDPTPRNGGNMPERELSPDGNPARGAPRHYVMGGKPKPARCVGLAAAIGTMVTAVLLSVLLTFSLTAKYYVKEPVIAAKPGEEAETSCFAELDTIDRLFRSLTVYYDLDDEALLTAVLKAYVRETGDEYAQYLTQQELEELINDQDGTLCGIGISVVKSTLGESDAAYDTIQVVNVYEDSPASEAGVQIGDCIIRIGSGTDAVSVGMVGYEKAIGMLRGEEGTQVTFTVLRGEQEIELTAVRRMLETKFVLSHVYAEDPTVGVVRITGFENPTAEQFRQAMDDLIAAGCTSFVVDVRNNPGGLLTSVEDVATFFLKEGDVILHTRSRAQMEKKEKTTYTVTVKDGQVTSGSRMLSAEDVGRYAGYPLTVLTNGSTASAAELFTANIRDHKLGTIVGTNTFGKGIMQTTYPLSHYGYNGALKLTTQYYDPPTGENYQGIGIAPDVVCELSAEAQEINFNLLTDANDNQLRRAVEALHE